MKRKILALSALLFACVSFAHPDHSASLSGPVAGQATVIGTPPKVPFAERGYVEEEYFVSGTAHSYQAEGPLARDGRAKAQQKDSAPYTTRLLVRRPAEVKKFNGTVLVEWLNVSAGSDAAPVYSYVHRQLVRDGYAWVGVSAQKVGIDGGSDRALSQIPPLKKANPQRYEKLTHPGDAYAFDVFSQAGQAVRGAAGAINILGKLEPQRVIAMGESQSASFLVTYVNAVDPLAKVFDGYLIHARSGWSPALDGVRPTRPADYFTGGTLIRDDVRVPVLMLQSETDLMYLRSIDVRQADAVRFRLWELPGAAHVDTYMLNASDIDTENVDPAQLAQALARTSHPLLQTSTPINSAPQQHYVAQAALAHLDRWVQGGEAPPKGQRMDVTTSQPAALVADENGNTRGGIRTPWVDVPIAKLSGLGQSSGPAAALVGTTALFDNAKLAQLYPKGRDEYLKKFAQATRAAVKAGFILAADEKEINALAAASYPAGPE